MRTYLDTGHERQRFTKVDVPRLTRDGPVHRADIAVVVSNGACTRDAKVWGERHGIHWVDRDRLRAWAEHGTPLHQARAAPQIHEFRRPDCGHIQGN